MFVLGTLIRVDDEARDNVLSVGMSACAHPVDDLCHPPIPRQLACVVLVEFVIDVFRLVLRVSDATLERNLGALQIHQEVWFSARLEQPVILNVPHCRIPAEVGENV